jgi:TonB family protein
MSTRHADILDQTESLRGPLIGSVAVHLSVAGALALYGWLAMRGRETFGEPNAAGGAVGVEVVNSIPLAASRGQRNPLANDTESQVPAPEPKPAAKQRAPEPDPDAVAISNRNLPKPPQREQTAQRFRPPDANRPNQLTSTEGQRVSAPIFSPAPGAGGVAAGPSSAFGTRFGAYEALMRQIIASKWRTADIDSNLRTAPVVIVTFEILRDGAIRNVQLLQTSGTSALDFSAQRAVLEANPLPALPVAFERNSANVEIWFQLKR